MVVLLLIGLTICVVAAGVVGMSKRPKQGSYVLEWHKKWRAYEVSLYVRDDFYVDSNQALHGFSQALMVLSAPEQLPPFKEPVAGDALYELASGHVFSDREICVEMRYEGLAKAELARYRIIQLARIQHASPGAVQGFYVEELEHDDLWQIAVGRLMDLYPGSPAARAAEDRVLKCSGEAKWEALAITAIKRCDTAALEMVVKRGVVGDRLRDEALTLRLSLEMSEKDAGWFGEALVIEPPRTLHRLLEVAQGQWAGPSLSFAMAERGDSGRLTIARALAKQDRRRALDGLFALIKANAFARWDEAVSLIEEWAAMAELLQYLTQELPSMVGEQQRYFLKVLVANGDVSHVPVVRLCAPKLPDEMIEAAIARLQEGAVGRRGGLSLAASVDGQLSLANER